MLHIISFHLFWILFNLKAECHPMAPNFSTLVGRKFNGITLLLRRKNGGHLTFGLRTYIAKILENYQQMFGEIPKHFKCPMEPGDHPEIDEILLLDATGVKKYQSLMGMLLWAVTLGRIDISCAVMTMGSFRDLPQESHLKRLKKICGYLCDHKEAFINYKVEIPDYSMYEVF